MRRFKAMEVKGFWEVWDTETQAWMTRECPNKEIAEEIAEDFEKMINKDFSPLFE